MEKLANIIFVLSLLSFVILVVMGVARDKRGSPSHETKEALISIGQWRASDGWNGYVFYVHAGLSLLAGFCVDYFV